VSETDISPRDGDENEGEENEGEENEGDRDGEEDSVGSEKGSADRERGTHLDRNGGRERDEDWRFHDHLGAGRGEGRGEGRREEKVGLANRDRDRDIEIEMVKEREKDGAIERERERDREKDRARDRVDNTGVSTAPATPLVLGPGARRFSAPLIIYDRPLKLQVNISPCCIAVSTENIELHGQHSGFDFNLFNTFHLYYLAFFSLFAVVFFSSLLFAFLLYFSSISVLVWSGLVWSGLFCPLFPFPHLLSLLSFLFIFLYLNAVFSSSLISVIFI
jgi:hypothetical protein